MIKENKTYFNYYKSSLIFSIIINLLFLYNIVLFKNIETPIRILFIISSICITIFFNIFLYLTKSQKIFNYIYIIFLIYQIILIVICYNLNNIYLKINKIANSTSVYSSSIVTLKDNDNLDLIDKIGIIDNNSIEGYVIPNEILKSNNLKIELIYYNDYISMINDLFDKKIEYIFLPTNYKERFKEIEFNGNINDLKIIYSAEKEKLNKTNNKKITEPFTILLMGVDGTDDNINNSFFNGDALILITFNPIKKIITLLSIPRDTYLNISCLNNRKNKITHAAWQDDECIINTLNNSFNINIDYYIKMNFKGLVNLVDNIGGIDVDVPYNFCESDSNRLWGSNTVYVKEGIQHLNGEQALALSRNRHPWPEFCDEKWTNYYSNDIIRGDNQQKVLNAIIDKVKKIKSINTFNNILDTISNNIITNLNTNNILSFYNTVKDINNINIQKLFLNGYDEYIYDFDYINNVGTKLTLYNYIPYKSSINEISKIMKDNINGTLVTITDTIGNLEDENDIHLMPNFIDKTYYEVVEFCNKHSIKLDINYVNGKKMGYVTSQDIQEFTDLEYIDHLTIDVVNSQNEIKTEIPKNESNKNNIEKNNKINENTNKEKNDNNELDPIINEIFN